jgi:uncharacterized protein (TIGR03086 family)
MQGNEQLSIIIPMLNAVADGIRDDQLAAPTPCTEFSVDGVLGHMTQLGSMFAPMFLGTPPDAAPANDQNGTSIEAFHRAMDALLAAVQSPGALDRTLETPAGPMPGAVFAKLVAFDGVIHGWDLASATGQAWDPPEALVEDLDTFVRGAIAPEMRGEAGFGPEQQPGADAGSLERLVAFSGRPV